jgi:hypothetical protein
MDDAMIPSVNMSMAPAVSSRRKDLACSRSVSRTALAVST